MGAFFAAVYFPLRFHTYGVNVKMGSESRVKGVDEDRVVRLAVYILENGATVRAAAKAFSVSKSTVHKDVSERLKPLDPSLYRQVRDVLCLNKAERHIRGGNATKEKYRLLAAKKYTLTEVAKCGMILVVLSTRRCGGTGRHKGLKIPRCLAYGFDSRQQHHIWV